MERTYNVLLTYDIDSRHTEVRNTLIEEYGFKDIIIGNNGTRCYLPNTTLLKRNTTKEDVHNIIKNVCKMLNANLKRTISSECSNWIALQGEKCESCKQKLEVQPRVACKLVKLCVFFIKNACYSVTKYYLCRQNNKRSLLGRKQQLEVARSFPNRYLFSYTNKVTSLFSIRYNFIIN